MKAGVVEIVGQQVRGAVVKAGEDSTPSSMLILSFEGGTSYEFYTAVGTILPVQRWEMHELDELRAWGEGNWETVMLAWLDDEGLPQVLIDEL